MTLPKPKGPGWEAKQWAIVIFAVFVAVLWLLTFSLFLIAIFIDSSPAEGNLGGAGVLIGVVAFILSFFAGFLLDEEF